MEDNGSSQQDMEFRENCLAALGEISENQSEEEDDVTSPWHVIPGRYIFKLFNFLFQMRCKS